MFAVLNTEITQEIICLSVSECVDRFSDLEEDKVTEMLNRELLGKDYVLRGNVIRDDFGPTVLPSMVRQNKEEYMEEAEKMLDELGGI
jgi:hypothetical protein